MGLFGRHGATIPLGERVEPERGPMPELVEVERYRVLAAEAVGWRVASVAAPDPLVAPGGSVLDGALRGLRLSGARRRGKLLLLDTDVGPTLGIRFGMTGTLLLDGSPGIDQLLYSPRTSGDRWVRFSLRVRRGRRERVLALSDPRRLGRVVLDPDEAALGPDAAGVSLSQLLAALGSSTTGPPLKARLLDQHRLAGVGNLIADEVLWRASLDPRRAASTLVPSEARRLHRHLRGTIADLSARGGSHLGDLVPERRPGGRCPRDGTPLVRATVGGRTTWWCPGHQH